MVGATVHVDGRRASNISTAWSSNSLSVEGVSAGMISPQCYVSEHEAFRYT